MAEGEAADGETRERASGLDQPGAMSVTLWIIAINVIVFVLDFYVLRSPRFIMQNPETGWVSVVRPHIVGDRAILPQDLVRVSNAMPVLQAYGHFSEHLAVRQAQAWRFLTFQFLHINLGHLLANMIGLYLFGMYVERHLGRRRYIAFYLVCGLSGPLMHMLLQHAHFLVSSDLSPMVGASAGVFGVLVGAARVAPKETLELRFLPLEVEIRSLALVMLVIAAVTVFTQGRNAGGEAAHLGGAVVGYLLVVRPHWLDFARWGKRGV